MTKIDQACSLLADLLKDGARDAAEILAVAEGDNLHERTMQRAAEQLGVIREKAGFASGWTWALPGPVEVRQDRSRAEVIASRLRKWEEARGRKAPIFAADPRIVCWAEAGISDPDLREAYDLATAYDDAPLTVGRLADHLNRLAA
jgi:endonuclease/exonuclease/phosphatase family metal-dependent hydrolase